MVKTFISESKANAKKYKYVLTYKGRRRLIVAGLYGSDKTKGDRLAVNSRVQGSAADVVKMAMIGLDYQFRTNPALAQCKLVAQIHDELIFEVH